jgi:hypothetical protein
MAIAAFWAGVIHKFDEGDKSEDSVQLEYGSARKAISRLLSHEIFGIFCLLHFCEFM